MADLCEVAALRGCPSDPIICNPTDSTERFIRWQGRLWSSNPAEWKQEVKRLAFATIDTALSSARNSVALP